MRVHLAIIVSITGSVAAIVLAAVFVLVLEADAAPDPPHRDVVVQDVYSVGKPGDAQSQVDAPKVVHCDEVSAAKPV
jgi:hypothetical protein